MRIFDDINEDLYCKSIDSEMNVFCSCCRYSPASCHNMCYGMNLTWLLQVRNNCFCM